LRSQLNIIASGDIGGFVPATVLVFNGVWGAADFKLDDVGFADETQSVVPYWQRSLDP
jgi:hypothetical protein